jgi:hypothetical protein
VAKDFTPAKRTQRVHIAIPVSVSEGPLQEDTNTLVVNARGALVSLRMRVTLGARLSVIHKKSGVKIQCSVVSRQEVKDGATQVGIAFDEPSPRYWGLAFPPEDWRQGDRKSPVSTVAGPAHS